VNGGRDLFAPKLGLTLPLCGLNFIFFLLAQMDPRRTFGLFAFVPDEALARPWSFVTYQFLNASPFGLFFGTLMLWILGSALEGEWGTGEFAAFWLVATLGGSLSAWLVGEPLVSGWAITGVSMLFAYAYLFPDMQFLIFFVVPVKVKWLAWLGAAMLGYTFLGSVLSGRAGAGFVTLFGTTAGFLFFWLRHRGAWRVRSAAKEAVQAVKGAGAVREDALLARRNRDLFPRVQELRLAARQGGDLPPRLRDFEQELGKLVVPGVKICKPVDFKGDQDGICVKCEGFAECSLRYVRGEPAEIVVKPRD